MVEIYEIINPEEQVLSAINQLLPQLSKSSPSISLEYLETLSSSNNTKLFVAKESDSILGMLSVVFCMIPTGTKAWIEDVVVDKEARGKGIGKALMNHALKEAKNRGAKSVDLTSRPSRETANELYKSIGFQVRETNIYRYRLL